MPVQPITRIIDGESFFLQPFQGYVKNVLRLGAMRAGLELPPLNDVGGEPLAAFVAQGRWVVTCDQGGCKNRQMVWLAAPLYMCSNCWNEATGGQWRPVEVPFNRHWIETLLMVRPDMENRNWLPEETERDLERENAEHGII